MAKNPFRNVRLAYRRSSPLLKCVLLGTVALCTAALIALYCVISGYQQSADNLRNQLRQLEEENDLLSKYIQELGTNESIRRIAREELGLVEEDMIFFTPTE